MIKINKRLHFLVVSVLLVGLYFLLLLGRSGWIGFAMMSLGGLAMIVILILFLILTFLLSRSITSSIHRKRVLFLIVLRIATIIWGLMDNGDMDGACHAYSYYIRGICDQQIVNMNLGLTLLCGFYAVIIIFIVEWYVVNYKKSKKVSS